MNNISIVPNHSEIFCRRLKSSKAADNLVRECYSVGIRVFRNAEKSFNALILDIFLNAVHIRTVGIHFNIYHLDAEMLKNSEMSVIAGAGAEEFNLTLLDPGLISAAAEYHAL